MKEPDILPEDMDEWEAEYYASKSSGGLVGLISFLALLLMVFSLAMIKLILSWL